MCKCAQGHTPTTAQKRGKNLGKCSVYESVSHFTCKRFMGKTQNIAEDGEYSEVYAIKNNILKVV